MLSFPNLSLPHVLSSQKLIFKNLEIGISCTVSAEWNFSSLTFIRGTLAELKLYFYNTHHLRCSHMVTQTKEDFSSHHEANWKSSGNSAFTFSTLLLWEIDKPLTKCKSTKILTQLLIKLINNQGVQLFKSSCAWKKLQHRWHKTKSSFPLQLKAELLTHITADRITPRYIARRLFSAHMDFWSTWYSTVTYLTFTVNWKCCLFLTLTIFLLHLHRSVHKIQVK